MKVILLKHINNLGRKGEVKEISDGYALNYLLPGKLVALANNQNLKQLQDQAQVAQKQQKAQISDKKTLVNRLQNLVLDFCEKADDKGTFFAGITAEKISGALLKRGLAVKPKQIKLDGHIKKAGEYQVVINLDGTACEIKIKTTNQ